MMVSALMALVMYKVQETSATIALALAPHSLPKQNASNHAFVHLHAVMMYTYHSRADKAGLKFTYETGTTCTETIALHTSIRRGCDHGSKSVV